MGVFKLTKRRFLFKIACAVSIILSTFIFTISYRTNRLTYLSRNDLQFTETDDREKIPQRHNQAETYNAVKVTPISDSDASDSERLQTILSCTNIIPNTDVHQEQLFWVLENFVKSEKQFKCYESITLSTQADFTFLDNVEVLVEKWRGPISLALYAPGDDFMSSLDSIAYLRNCQSELIKDLVTFHVFFDTEHTPKLKLLYWMLIKVGTRKIFGANVTLLDSYVDYHDCKTIPYQVDHDKIYKQQKNLTYSINIARNLARRTAATHFVFPTDIELYPSPNFIQKFLGMIARDPSLADISPPRVFVAPLFELVKDADVPQTKTELQEMIKAKQSFVFHAHLCLKCHKIPKYNEWLQEKDSNTLSVFTSTKRLGYHTDWEPFFVGTNSEPWFDERLTWEGQSNKMTQGLIMCLLDYNYMVLDNAFLIHKPGIKTQKTQLHKYAKDVTKTIKLLKKYVKYELTSIYGFREGCQWFQRTITSKTKTNVKSDKKKKQ